MWKHNSPPARSFIHSVAPDRIRGVRRRELALLFNSDFYCIYGHDDEVVQRPAVQRIVGRYAAADRRQSEALHEITDRIAAEYAVADNLREEMLRILLKRFIITCTRMARERFAAGAGSERQFDIVRRYYVLVDRYFREKKQVQEYALLLHRSPKTLSNLFAVYGLPSPLQVIRDRTQAEARRLLLYTSKSAKEVAGILGFEDAASFSRFFKGATGKSISEYRSRK